MTNFTYLRNDQNLLSAAPAIAPSTADANYPIGNLTALPISKVFRFSALSDQYLAIDMGAGSGGLGVPISFIGLVNHNLSSAATIVITAGLYDDYVGFSQAMTWREFDAFLWLSTVQVYRHWKISISDPTNADGFIQLGLGLMGTATTLGFQQRYGSMRTRTFANAKTVTDWGVKHLSKMARPKKYTSDFTNLRQSQADVLTALSDALNGDLTPIFIMPDPSFYDGYFVRLVGDAVETFVAHTTGNENVVSMTMNWEEESRGRKMPA